MKIKKIISFIFLSFLLVLTSCFNDKECKHESTTWIVDKEASCIEVGLKHEECNDCHEKLKEETIGALGHNESEWIIDKEPTCTTEGLKHKECTICGNTLETKEIDKKEHNLEHYETKPATCTESGYEAYDICKNCDYTTYKEIEALGHNYENGECTRCHKKISIGLEYKLNEDNESYSVVGIGTCTDTEIVISNIYNDLPVTVIEDSLFESVDSLLSIEIPGSIVKIGNMAELENIEIYKIYYNGTIEDWCDVTLNSGIFLFTKQVYMKNSNNEYEEVTEIEIPNTITKIKDFQFVGFQNITKVILPNNVTSIGSYAFAGCSSLKNIEIPNSVTNIGEYAFIECISLTRIEIPNSVTSIGEYAFMDCSSLTSIEIPNSVISIGDWAFSYCSNLKRIEIPNSVTSIGEHAFEDCSSLTSIEIPNSLTSIGEYAFYWCNSLTTIINNSDLKFTFENSDNGYISYYAYKIINKDGSITYKEEDTYTYIETEDNFLFRYDSYNNYQLVAYLGTKDLVTLPEDINGNSYEIYFMKGVKNVIIPNTFTRIGYRAFEYCSSLENIYYEGTIEDWCNIKFDNYSSNPVYYANHFYIKNSNGEYEEVTEIEIPDTITKIGNYQFYGFNNVTKVTIPNSVTSIGENAFSGCSSLTNIRFAENSQLTNIGEYAFSYCRSLTSIEIPNSVISIGYWAFGICSSLTSIVVPNSVTSIGEYAFYNCSSLTSIIFAEESQLTSIGSFAFLGCSSLTSIEIPNSVTYIGNGAFYGCSSLTSIEIPNSVTSIGEWAFYGCNNLTIYCEASSKPSGWSSYWNPSNCPVVWGYLNPYKITYILNGGTNPSNAVTSFDEIGLEYSELPIPTKSGFAFDGWYLDENFSTKADKLEGSDVTLYACWRSTTHTILYNVDGGILPTDVPTEFDERSGLYDLPIPTKEGYIFVGWSPSYIAQGTTKDVTLKAIWKEKLFYKITYEIGNGTLSSDAPTSFEAGVGVTLVDAISNDSSVTFLYWADENGNAVTRINSHTYKNKTLTAMYGVPADYEPLWTLNQIGFDGKGMTYEIKVDDVKESDPFDLAYNGSKQKIKQKHQDLVNSAYNINILYSNYGDDAPWGPERVSWINSASLEKNFGNVYAVEIYSQWIPTLVRGGSIAELYNTNSETGIFAELSSKKGNGYEQDDTINQTTSVKGKVYGYKTGVARPDYFMYYNVDKVKSLGLEDPAELWMKGEWSMSYFEAWVKNAQAKLGSGEYVLDMGYAESIIGLVASTGNRMAIVSPARLFLTTKNVTDRISWLQEAYSSGLYYQRGVQDVSPGFQSGVTLLHSGYLSFLKESTKFDPLIMDFTIGVVPYPTDDGEGGEVVTTTDVSEAIDLGGGKYLTDDAGNYIKTVDMSGSSFQVPYTDTNCYSIANINNGKNGITSKIAIHILNDLVAGLGDDPNDKIHLTQAEVYRCYLEERFEREIDIAVIMSCQDSIYFEIMELLSMTVGSGSNYGEGAFWPLAASMVKSTDSAATALNEVLPKYKAAMTELCYNIY